MDTTKSSSGFASYIQYNDRLRVEFNVSLYSWIYNSTYCLKVPETTNFDTTYYEASIYAFDYNSYNYLTDLELYFLPTREYIGSDNGLFASNYLSSWPIDYDYPSLTAVNSGKILTSLSSGFTEICFANNCGGSSGCNLNNFDGGYNTFVGYVDLFGVTTTDISNVQLAAPTAQPTSNSYPTYYSPNNNYPHNYYGPSSPSKSDSIKIFPNKALIKSDSSSIAILDFNFILAPYAYNSDSYSAPTAQPTSNSYPTYYSPSNSYPNNNSPSNNNYPSNSYPSPSYTYPTINYPSYSYPSSRYTSYPSPSYTYPTSNKPGNSFNESYTWSSISSSKATSWNDICTSISG
eukprot:gene25196-32871_t